MYNSLHQCARREVKGLFCVGAGRPADLLLQPNTHQTSQRLAIDFGISCPSSATNIAAGSDRNSGASAAAYTTSKVTKHRNHRGAAALPFEYQPVIFESSGGFGESAISWWKNVRALDERINAPVSGGVSPVLPPDQYTWSAQRFSSYWLQRISLAMALAYSTHSDLVLTQCDGFGADPG